MRFSEKGVIKITVRVINGFLNLELSDEGIGMVIFILIIRMRKK